MRQRLVLILALWLGAVPLAHAQVIGQPTTITAQSSSVCATANAFAAFPVGNSASMTFGITGTWSGTLTFKSTADGSTWVTTQVTNLGSGSTPVTTATANGQFGLSNSGLLTVCVDATSFASGTATVTLTRGWSAKGGGATGGSGGTVTGGTCTNQVTTAISTSGVPTCTTVTSAYKDTSIASTGVDINTSYQVTATHLAAALPTAQGGWGSTTPACSPTAPTISSGFGSSPSIVNNNGTCAFEINVGTGGSASTGVIGLPAAAHGWVCQVGDITTSASFVTYQAAPLSTTSAQVANTSRTTGLNIAWTASDHLVVSCFGY